MKFFAFILLVLVAAVSGAVRDLTDADFDSVVDGSVNVLVEVIFSNVL